VPFATGPAPRSDVNTIDSNPQPGVRVSLLLRGMGFACVAAVVLVACGAGQTGVPQTTAIKAATSIAQGMSTTPVHVVSASSGPFAHFEPTVSATIASPTRVVWTVVFDGTFSSSCGPATATPHACPSNSTVRVILDYATGKFVMGQTPAGAG
jgi:ABC-type phosphate transport system substrate-binding protein